MTVMLKHFVRGSIAAAAAILLAAPLAARADVPDAAGAQAAQARVSGTIADFHGKYGIVVRDDRGALVEVVLHQGTVIEPLGLRLERGMRVTVSGTAHDRTLAANRIETPYRQRPVAVIPPDRLRNDSPGLPWGTSSVRDNWGSTNPGNLSTSRPEAEVPAPRGTPQ
jgi:hypothetical protein